MKLTLTEKGGEPKVLTFDKDEITIGRVSGNDIVLAKGNISKRHSRLTMRSGEMEIADLKSTNGTYVNGRKITGPTPIAASDRVYVGDFLIGIEGPGGAPPVRRLQRCAARRAAGCDQRRSPLAAAAAAAAIRIGRFAAARSKKTMTTMAFVVQRGRRRAGVGRASAARRAPDSATAAPTAAATPRHPARQPIPRRR